MVLEPPRIEIRDTGTQKGRGAFASVGFHAGEIIELCPVIVFVAPFDSMPESLRTRVFDWHVLAGGPDNAQAIALGYGCMYNHANPANMRYEADPSRLFLRFVAVREIAMGEELTVNYNAYGGGPEWADNWWFERVGINPV